MKIQRLAFNKQSDQITEDLNNVLRNVEEAYSWGSSEDPMFQKYVSITQNIKSAIQALETM